MVECNEYEKMHKIKIAINGFGRIGRLIYRIFALKSFPHIEIIAINDIAPIERLAYLLKYDSIYGPWSCDIEIDQQGFYSKQGSVKVFNEKNPLNLPWKQLSIDYVIESSGCFINRDEAEKHLYAGAKRVVITAPAKGEIPTLVMGVNHQLYNSEKDTIISNASCTTNCLAILIKILLENFGIEEGLMSTIHAMTASQSVIDSASSKDWRTGRAANLNIIPSSTGAAHAVELCLPEIKGKLTGMAFRVPTSIVSAVDLTVRLTRDTSYDEICAIMKEASQGSYKDFLSYCEEPLVSSDFIGMPYSCIFDKNTGIALNQRFYKLVAWYDNEWGYANRIVDFVIYMAEKENTKQKTYYKNKEVDTCELYSRTHY